MRPSSAEGPLSLAIDTSTRRPVVALGLGPGWPAIAWAGTRGSPDSLAIVDLAAQLLREAGRTRQDLDLLVVGTGPGSFTGLRVGLATAKTLAHVLGRPIVGVPSTDALRQAAVDGGAASPDAAVVLPAGARDHYLALPGRDPLIVPPGRLAEALEGRPAIAVGLSGELLGAEASARGEVAIDGLPRALLALAQARHARGEVDDAATLTPAYVALPRGVGWSAEEVGWSPDLR